MKYQWNAPTVKNPFRSEILKIMNATALFHSATSTSTTCLPKSFKKELRCKITYKETSQHMKIISKLITAVTETGKTKGMRLRIKKRG